MFSGKNEKKIIQNILSPFIFECFAPARSLVDTIWGYFYMISAESKTNGGVQLKHLCRHLDIYVEFWIPLCSKTKMNMKYLHSFFLQSEILQILFLSKRLLSVKRMLECSL